VVSAADPLLALRQLSGNFPSLVGSRLGPPRVFVLYILSFSQIFHMWRLRVCVVGTERLCLAGFGWAVARLPVSRTFKQDAEAHAQLAEQQVWSREPLPGRGLDHWSRRRGPGAAACWR
jgi:hypothetical protein